MVTTVSDDLTPSMARDFADASLVAWDTETTGLDWRTDRLALCQLSAAEVGTVLVRVADRQPKRLLEILESTAVAKVFHHAPFDLRFMRRAWGAQGANVRCTKVASKLLQPHAPPGDHSLGALLQRYQGIVLDKGAVRVSDWTAQTLSTAQVAYAAGDVEFLIPLLGSLEAELSSIGLSGLYAECCAFLPSQVEVSLRGVDDIFAY